MKKSTKMATLAPLKMSQLPSSIVSKLTEGFSATSKTRRESLVNANLQLRPWNKREHRSISLKRIVRVKSWFYRMDQKDDFEDLRTITILDPPEVAALKDTNFFVPLDGWRRIQHLTRTGVTRIKCRVVGIAESHSQLAAARTIATTKRRKPHSNFELAYGLVHLYFHLRKEFGEFFCTQGGNQKGKFSSSKYIADIVGMKKWAVRAMIDFGRQLGPYALVGLHRIEEIRDLPLRKIQKLNGPIREADLKYSVRKEVLALRGSGASEAEMVTEAGRIVHQFIEEEKLPEVSKTKIDFSEVDAPPKNKGTRRSKRKTKNNGGQENGGDSEKAAKNTKRPRQKQDLIECVKEVSNASKGFLKFLTSEDDTSEVDFDEFEEWVEEMSQAWFEYTKCIEEVIKQARK